MNAKIIFSKAIVLCAALILFSCQSKEEKVISDLNDLAEQIKNNHEDWDAKDWMAARMEYEQIRDEAKECNFSSEQEIEYEKARKKMNMAMLPDSYVEGMKAITDAYAEGMKSISEGMAVGMKSISDGMAEGMKSISDEFAEEDEDEDDKNEDGALPMVYSNCYDGYLNVREEPSSKSKILSTLPNGPDGAELLGVEGKWSKVRVNGVVGYIWSADVLSTPTEPVYISTSDVVGTWGCAETGPLTINSNGKFSHRLGLSAIDAIVMEGTWHLTRDKIVFKYYDDGSIMTCTVNGDEMVNDDEEIVFTKG